MLLLALIFVDLRDFCDVSECIILNMPNKPVGPTLEVHFHFHFTVGTPPPNSSSAAGATPTAQPVSFSSDFSFVVCLISVSITEINFLCSFLNGPAYPMF